MRPLAKGVTDLGAPARGTGAVRAAFRSASAGSSRCACSTPAAPVSCGPARRAAGLAADRSRRGAGADARRAAHERHAGRPSRRVRAGRFLRRRRHAADRLRPGRRRPAVVPAADAGGAAVPPPPQTDWRWLFRGDNLCAWETGLRRPLRSGEIVIDPDIGRVLIGLDTAAQARRADRAGGTAASCRACSSSFTYGAAGPVGAHPVTRSVPASDPAPSTLRRVGDAAGRHHPAGGAGRTSPSATQTGRDRDPRQPCAPRRPVAARRAPPSTARVVAATRAIADDPRGRRAPPDRAAGAASVAAAGFGRRRRRRSTRRCGSRALPRARRGVAVPRRERADRSRGRGAARDRSAARWRPAATACATAAVRRCSRRCTSPHGYGFADPADVDAFVPTPDIVIQRSITGALAIDERYRLDIEDSIVDAGLGFGRRADRRSSRSPRRPTRPRRGARRSTSTA